MGRKTNCHYQYNLSNCLSPSHSSELAGEDKHHVVLESEEGLRCAKVRCPEPPKGWAESHTVGFNTVVSRQDQHGLLSRLRKLTFFPKNTLTKFISKVCFSSIKNTDCGE